MVMSAVLGEFDFYTGATLVLWGWGADASALTPKSGRPPQLVVCFWVGPWALGPSRHQST